MTMDNGLTPKASAPSSQPGLDGSGALELIDGDLHAVTHVLWAASPRFQRAQLVAAWSEGLVEAFHEWYLELRDTAMREFAVFGDGEDGPWTFWTTVERVPRPTIVGDPIDGPRPSSSGPSDSANGDVPK